MSQPASLPAVLNTSLALLDQFVASLEQSNTSQGQAQPQTPSTDHPSPSHLLSACANSLKSSVTKISLLTITVPFTSTAVVSIIQSLNTSILPNLVTATLLTSPTLFPDAYSQECNTLTRSSLRDLRILLSLVKTRSEADDPKSEITDTARKNVTETTGKIWEDCDLLIRFAKEGVAGYVCRRVNQWLELMKDAVKEFEEWDPEEEVGDDPFGLDGVSSEPEDEADGTADTNRAVISAGVKDQALKVLSRIPQSIHVVVKQRLQKLPTEPNSNSNAPMVPMPSARKKTINRVLKNTRKISDCIDESAEAMYMGDLELCLKKAGEARALAIDVVQSVEAPWEDTQQETKEDQYIKRALVWIQQVGLDDQHIISNGADKGKGRA